jgi:hypothetical protein
MLAATIAFVVGGWFLLVPHAGDGAAASVAPAIFRPAPPRPPPPSPAPVFVRDSFPDEFEHFAAASRAAWGYAERQYQPATGLINSVTAYPYATMWDIASGLAATYCAHELQLVETDEYHRRMSRALSTLKTMRMFDDVAYNKNYSTTNAAIAGRDDRDRRTTQRGYGWSATDMGRLLVWLRIIHQAEPRYAARIDSIVARVKYPRLVADGYLWGETVNRGGRTTRYTEGRIPYEQYAASGFALWGKRAELALKLNENAIPVTVMGVPLVADRRGYDHMTSEPIVLAGLETGWTPEMRDLALRMLAVQRERFQRTGQVTIVSEDAIPRAPHYFYYYSVNLGGRWFSVSAQNPNQRLAGPRWVSAKAAYGWHALLPSEYTMRGVRAVAPARTVRGWGSGVYEQTGRPTGGENINTAAVILEAALVRKTGKPLLRAAASTPRAPAPRVPPATQPARVPATQTAPAARAPATQPAPAPRTQTPARATPVIPPARP